MKNTKVIATFPACGKTYFFENSADNVVVLDSDSSKFSWMTRKRTEEELEEIRRHWDSEPHLLSGAQYINKIRNEEITVRDPSFPDNYIEHIKENIGKADYIFVSTHSSVRAALINANIDFTLVFPERSLKAEWVGRCFIRGSTTAFCGSIATMWDIWQRELEETVANNDLKCYRLKHGEYLSDVLENI